LVVEEFAKRFSTLAPRKSGGWGGYQSKKQQDEVQKNTRNAQ
jgi:hypothetical protein